MRFTKMHGLGNDFIIVEDFDLGLTNYAELAMGLCNRNFGIGADGLALLQPSEQAAFRVRIFNPDGSEAELCGNLLRCAGKYLYEKGHTGETVIPVEMYDKIKVLRLAVTDGVVQSVEVDMGEPILESDLVPVAGKRRQAVNEEVTASGEKFVMTAVSMGNPHCVIFVDETAAVPLETWGPALEAHPDFPKKTNVEFVEVRSRDEAAFRVWERGAGATLACGSGACAVLVAGVLSDKLNRKATLHLPGGSLEIEWRDDNHVYMTGPAAEVFRGELVTDEQFKNKYLRKGRA
ncbi:diaminopimelate epimerase [Dethiobacter alkaliphilus]|uniref:diaminopimelate epimerase n=1 Tax=Dethiobacter alkaliphilus TaxID=427926 RepID=UPI002226640E|nr:diaminopimelate epimerase [Dethiobacter alkaliphilus]MCW3491305.1 diaminopimelate epimerase [Dethiobacter alkaliphilus]